MICDLVWFVGADCLVGCGLLGVVVGWWGFQVLALGFLVYYGYGCLVAWLIIVIVFVGR